MQAVCMQSALCAASAWLAAAARQPVPPPLRVGGRPTTARPPFGTRPALWPPNSLPQSRKSALFRRYHQLRPGQNIIVLEEGGEWAGPICCDAAAAVVLLRLY